MQTAQALQNQLLSESQGQLTALVEQMDALRKQKKELQEQIKDINASLENLELMLLTRMKEAGLQNFKTDKGLQAIIKKDLFVHVDKTKEGELFEWLQETGRGDVIKPTVHHQTLKAIIREALENAIPIPECVNIFEKERITLRRGKK